ncbi:uncharacterized protein LOC121381394 [Gigantopelta aegis]|uniref:uncharacterized protein LOC121381394 n=1 Tax=Gigantopelta aegis TaxID=1735272 RepID=UPI001B88E195|nr:uncharacterized protein LOC121381394 [Gigantopelta aegis]
MWINPLGISAFITTLVATVLIVVAFILPQWWVITTRGGRTTSYGLWTLTYCTDDGCHLEATSQIEGGKEFLFISKVFETLAVGLSLVGLILHTVYIPWRKVVVRSLAIYCLGAAGLFVMLAVFIYIGKFQSLGEQNRSLKVGASFAISLVGGVVCLVASALTAIASVRKASRHEDEERLDTVILQGSHWNEF